MACDCGYNSPEEIWCDMLTQLETLVSGGAAAAGIDFELRTVKDSNGDLFQLRVRYDEDTETYTIDHIDASGAVATPVGTTTYLDPTAPTLTLGQQTSANSAPVVLSVEQEAILDGIDTTLLDVETLLTTLVGLFTGTVQPKSQAVPTGAPLVLPANAFSSVTLIVESGEVDFDGETHGIGEYTWDAPLLKKLEAMTFDATAVPTTVAKILTTQITS